MVVEPLLAYPQTNMTSGNNFNIRKAVLSDIDSIKKLVDQHKKELGFVTRPAINESIERSELLVALEAGTDNVIGLVHYRHRLDGQTTLYNLAVIGTFRHIGVAQALINTLRAEAVAKKQKLIFLKCPQVLASNAFYRQYGFTHVVTEPGKKLPLNIWKLDLSGQL